MSAYVVIPVVLLLAGAAGIALVLALRARRG